MITKMKASKGFSLIEVLISLLVLSIGVLGLVKLQTYMEVKSENALKTLDALYIAETQMEHYQTRANNISGAVGLISFVSMADSTYCLNSMAASQGFSLLCNVSSPISALSGALRTIDVTVSWTDRHGASQAVALQTAVSKFSEFD